MWGQRLAPPRLGRLFEFLEVPERFHPRYPRRHFPTHSPTCDPTSWLGGRAVLAPQSQPRGRGHCLPPRDPINYQKR